MKEDLPLLAKTSIGTLLFSSSDRSADAMTLQKARINSTPITYATGLNVTSYRDDD